MALDRPTLQSRYATLAKPDGEKVPTALASGGLEQALERVGLGNRMEGRFCV
jgi:hypothetical protein